MEKLFMRKLFLAILSCVSLLFAGVDMHINLHVPVPEIVFPEPPRVVVATPGIYVVPDYPEEVFFVSGSYWVVRDGHWFRSRGQHKKWTMVSNSRVPRGIMKIPRGKYKNWHPERHDKKRDFHSDGDRGRDHGHGHWK
jgi:hypothetical protein